MLYKLFYGLRRGDGSILHDCAMIREFSKMPCLNPQTTCDEEMVGTTLEGRMSGRLFVVEITNQGGWGGLSVICYF